jgi:hypothetical protein
MPWSGCGVVLPGRRSDGLVRMVPTPWGDTACVQEQPFDVEEATRIAERELAEQLIDGGSLDLRRFSCGWLATCRFGSVRPPGDVVLVLFDDGPVTFYPSWSLDGVIEMAEDDYDRRHGGAERPDRWGNM